MCAEIKKYEEQYHSIEIPNQESVVTYFKIRQQLAKLGKEIQEFIHRPKYCLPFLQPGRLVKVESCTPAVCSPALLPAFSRLRPGFTTGEERGRRLRLGRHRELQQEDQREGECGFGRKGNVEPFAARVTSCVSPFRAAQTPSRCTWWRFCSTAARRASKTLRPRRPNPPPQGRWERCRWVQRAH